MKLLRSKLQLYGDQVVQDLRRKSPVASGSLASSYSSRVVEIGSYVQLEVYGSSHFKYVEFGRKAGKSPKVDSIVEWMRSKGLQPYEGQTIKQAAYLIGRKIGRDGIQGKRFLEDILQQNLIPFADQALVAFGDDIKLVLEDETKKLK